jgi:hypothetical protein
VRRRPMDGRTYTILLTMVLPAILVALTVWKFASNPVAILVLLTTMVIGGFYLLTYRDTAGA